MTDNENILAEEKTAAANKKNTKKVKEPTFEESMARLEAIVHALEDGRCGLDESIRLYEEGVALVRRCSAVLTEAKQKVTVLSAEGQEK